MYENWMCHEESIPPCIQVSQELYALRFTYSIWRDLYEIVTGYYRQGCGDLIYEINFIAACQYLLKESNLGRY
jgi:hypothetical protein